MSRCSKCVFAMYDQFKGYRGRWLCLHPHRAELSNKGVFIYPEDDNPSITICETPADTSGDLQAQALDLKAAETPVWCYFEAVERAREEQPGFDPDKQRSILWPAKEAFVNDQRR